MAFLGRRNMMKKQCKAWLLGAGVLLTVLSQHAQATVCTNTPLYQGVSEADTVMLVAITATEPLGDKDQNNVQQYQNTFWLLQGYKGNENSVAYIQTAVAEEPNLLHEDPSFAVKEGEQVLVLAKERQIPSFIGCALSAVLWRKLSWDEKVFMWVYEHRWAIGVGIVLLMVVTVKRWRERRMRA